MNMVVDGRYGTCRADVGHARRPPSLVDDMVDARRGEA
jgi:hypothetical protein